jgi:hypothetical protein
MTPIRNLLGVVGCCWLLAACASRPSEADLTDSILTAANTAGSNVALTQEQAACIAKALLASELSDTTLSGLADNFDNPEVLEAEVADVEPAVVAAAGECQ